MTDRRRIAPAGLARRYREGATLADLSEITGLAQSSIRQRLCVAGEPIRAAARRKNIAEPYLPRSQTADFGTSEERSRYAAAEQGSRALAAAIWRYFERRG